MAASHQTVNAYLIAVEDVFLDFTAIVVAILGVICIFALAIGGKRCR